ncbi:uncharacterized protein LOC134178235 isoform X1 [Corticium candelabrum]|uniref:uncharacterized protein LOC134178235 isoform X1 n=1 Tax=Corticium candelabrum TaxID=121492 RepID=UPI002E25CFF4|nr:uncharacterized protein LOC134178235 isoform X1 [Corticium candelabrum]
MLLKHRSNKAMAIPLMMTMMMIGRGTNRQVIHDLNHLGVAASYDQGWRYLEGIAEEQRKVKEICKGPCLWVYDNLNITKNVAHQRKEDQTKMWNMTTRLVIQIDDIPADQPTATATKRRQDLKEEDILPSSKDADEIYENATSYLMFFLTSKFDYLQHLTSVCPRPVPYKTPTKAVVAPLEILDINERSTDGNIQVLENFARDTEKSETTPVPIVGDQLTCKNIRGARRLRLPETQELHKLTWAKESPGDFHFTWECLTVCIQTLWGSAKAIGTLKHLQDIVHRTSVDKNVKKFRPADEFLTHAFEAHLIAAICKHFGIQKKSDPIPHPKNIEFDWLRKNAEEILSKTIAIKDVQYPDTDDEDEIYMYHRTLLRMGYLYTNLRQAIRYENGPEIIRMWRTFLLYFLGAGKSNYASEAANLLANLAADWPTRVAYIHTHHRTVNTAGKAGHGKPVDQLIEHYNLIVKNAVRSAGPNLTKKHLAVVSRSAFALYEATQMADTTLGRQVEKYHSVRSPDGDINDMVEVLLAEEVVTEKSGRRLVDCKFSDPRRLGIWKKEARWITKFLAKTSKDEERSDEQAQECREVEDPDDIELF